MSDQTPGQGHDGSASKSSSPPQLSSTLLAEDSHTPEAVEGDNDPKTVENIAEADGGGYGDVDEDEEAQQEENDNDEEYDDFNINELPERPASRHDFSSDDEGVMVKFQQRRKRFSRSPALSNISEDSNETTGSPNASRRAGRQLVTGHGLRDNEQEEDNLADVLDTRGRLFDRIFVRLREESLYTNPQALMAAVVMGTMLGEEAAHWWSANDLENRFTSHIEDFRQANAQPRDDGTVLPLEMQNQITEQLQGLAYILQGDAERWHAQGLSNDTDYIMQITESIDNLLEGRPRTAPTSRVPSTGSNGSGPERVLPLLDRQALRRRGREDLIEIIIQQDDKRRADMDQFEADIEVATTQANAERDDAKAELRLLTAHTQQLREIAHENGLNNRDLEGRPLHMERTPAVSRRDEQDGPDEYIDRLESELDECNKARDKDLESLRYLKLERADLRLEIADLTANLDSAREEARQALEQRDRIHTDGVNTEDRESVNEMSGQELPAAPVSEASTRGQEPPPTPTSHVSTDQGITTDRQSSYGTDVDLEALRREHQQEVAQLRADHAKEISELRQDFEDDRRRAQGSRPQNLMVDGEFLPSQETSNRSISSQAAERRDSSENDFVTDAIPGLEKLLVSLWDDDDESAEFIAGVEQSHQQEHPNQFEPEPTSDLALASPAREDSHRESGERPASARVTNEKGDLETKILELTKAHSTLQRDRNTQKQIREGNTARIRQLEGQSMALQDALQKEMLRNEALQKQLAMPERDSTDPQRDLEANRKIKRQQGVDLERIRSILASRGSEQQSSLRSGPPPHGTSGVSIQAGPPTGHASNASTTSSSKSQERGQLLNLAAQVANRHAREHTGGPLDEAQRLAMAGQAADLYLRQIMEEQSSPENDEEDGKERDGEIQPSVTKNGQDVENGSAGGGRNGRSDHNQPLYIDPTWLSLHPNGACDQCVPVLRFPTAIFPGSSDPGPCRCGPANRVDPHIAESRSSHGSGSRSVAFSDENGANNHDVPEGCATTKFPRSILKKPRFIDTARAKAPTRGALPRSPYPKRTRSLPDWNAAQLPTPRQTQRSQSASSTRSRSSSSLPSRQLSHDVSVPIIPVQKSCCEHFDKLKRVCACNGRCEYHWCCKHWDLTGVCKCEGKCHKPCCKDWGQDSNCCDCVESCAEHTGKKCCPCGFKPGTNVCACDKTCRDHAVCEDYRTFKPRELSCMAGCDAYERYGKCEHEEVCRRKPCDSHPCCMHHAIENTRAYCGCGKTCALHVCCSHYLPGFKTCECQGTCEDHLPVIPKPLRQHFRDVAAVVEAGTSPADLIADLYYPSGTMFPRQEGQPYDWNQVVQANADLLRSHDLLGSNGEILVPRNVPASGPRQRVDLASAVAMQGSLAPDDKEGGRARSQASQDDLVSLATSTAPSAPPGAHQAALRSASGFQRGARDGGMSTEMRDDALPHFPQPNPGRLLPDSLLEFHGPQPDFDNDEDEDSTRSTRVSSRRAACTGGAHAICSCNCRCRGDGYNVLTGSGGRFAFYTCRRLYRGGPEKLAVIAADHEDEGEDLDSTRAAGGSSNYSLGNSPQARSRTSSRQTSQRETGSRQGSQVSDYQSVSSHGISRQGSLRAGSQGSQQHTQSAVAQAGSQHSSQGIDSQTGSGQSSRYSSTRSGLSSASDHGPNDQNLVNSGLGGGGPNPNDPRDAGSGGGEGPGRHRRRARRPPPNPWRQIWDFTWLLIRFFTYGQAANLWAIFRFAYNVALLNIQHALDFLQVAQPWQHLPNPRLPHAEIISFSIWLLLVWHLTMMIALGEERRLWLAANPRTAAYVRGLQVRNPYPLGGLYQVDYALLEPALGGLSVWLHKLYFRPGALRSVGEAVGVVAGFWRSLLQMLSYAKVEEAVVHVKDMVVNAGTAVVTSAWGIVAAVWVFFLRLVPSWPELSSVRPVNIGDPVNLEMPVKSVHLPNLSDPRVVHGGPAWWQLFWEYFTDLMVRTVTGRRKVSHE